MELKIIYSKEAKLLLHEIFLLYTESVGIQTSKNFIKSLKKRIELLSSNPYLGKIIGNNNEYRYLIFHYYLIIYKVVETENKIKILLIFDTRQNPDKLIEKLKKLQFK